MVEHSPVLTGPPVTLADSDLLRLHTGGDREAFGMLYQRHRSRLWNVAARITGAQDADDAVQNGMLRAYRSVESFRGDSAVTTWLHRITVNAAIDIARRRPLVAEAEDLPDQSPGTTTADTRMDVRKQWLRLSAEHRAALLLVDMMGYPMAEAARIVGVAEGTMKSRAARARAALSRKLAQPVACAARPVHGVLPSLASPAPR